MFSNDNGSLNNLASDEYNNPLEQNPNMTNIQAIDLARIYSQYNNYPYIEELFNAFMQGKTNEDPESFILRLLWWSKDTGLYWNYTIKQVSKFGDFQNCCQLIRSMPTDLDNNVTNLANDKLINCFDVELSRIEEKRANSIIKNLTSINDDPEIQNTLTIVLRLFAAEKVNSQLETKIKTVLIKHNLVDFLSLIIIFILRKNILYKNSIVTITCQQFIDRGLSSSG